ncbi:MAG TPA: response regulator transcription factor [Anaerolineae bacterium]|nr:response regulator transcription factor [Anaerolineae bacterium]
MTATNAILVIDDEPNLRRSLALVLQRAGYQVTTAEDAQAALCALQAGAFDLAFLDIKLPDMNGMELLPQIRRLCPDLPVLILTAHATLDSAMAAVRQGARDYLLKPLRAEQILTRVREVLAEQAQPKRRQELVAQLEGLLAELHQVDDPHSPAPAIPYAQPPADPARYLRRGPLMLDLHARRALLQERHIPLPPSTFDYLTTLMRHAPDPVKYETLVLESQGYAVSRTEAREIAGWQIHELRQALEPDPQQPSLIITVRNVGYRLVT